MYIYIPNIKEVKFLFTHFSCPPRHNYLGWAVESFLCVSYVTRTHDACLYELGQLTSIKDEYRV